MYMTLMRLRKRRLAILISIRCLCFFCCNRCREGSSLSFACKASLFDEFVSLVITNFVQLDFLRGNWMLVARRQQRGPRRGLL